MRGATAQEPAGDVGLIQATFKVRYATFPSSPTRHRTRPGLLVAPVFSIDMKRKGNFRKPHTGDLIPLSRDKLLVVPMFGVDMKRREL